MLLASRNPNSPGSRVCSRSVGDPAKVVTACRSRAEEDPPGNAGQEDDGELHAFAARGWTVSAIARRTGWGARRFAGIWLASAAGNGPRGRDDRGASSRGPITGGMGEPPYRSFPGIVARPT
jgi:hypothetical protein